jgi:N-acetyl-anhydromuramoyl-L-alanine amidase
VTTSDSKLSAGQPRASWVDGWWRGAKRVPSPNADARPGGEHVRLIVIHSISLPPGVYGGTQVEDLFLNRLDHHAHPYFERLSGLRVSSHFYVRRTGTVVQFVSGDRRAWHAGVSRWRERDACNDFSVGIELEGLEGQSFEQAQYAALVRLVRAVSRRWPIEGIAGHEHIAPGRKRDPGPGFEWPRLKAQARLPWRWFSLHGTPPVKEEKFFFQQTENTSGSVL